MNTVSRLALLVTLGLMPLAQATELGRLFFSADERKQLDQHQALHTQGEGSAPAPSGITVNGLVQRNDGSRTAWINGKAQHDAPGKNINAVPVNIPGQNGSIEVKVGQRIQIDNIPAPRTENQTTSK